MVEGLITLLMLALEVVVWLISGYIRAVMWIFNRKPEDPPWLGSVKTMLAILMVLIPIGCIAYFGPNFSQGTSEEVTSETTINSRNKEQEQDLHIAVEKDGFSFQVFWRSKDESKEVEP